MTDMSPREDAVTLLRRQISHVFWYIWKNLPVSPRQRQSALTYLYQHMPYLVSWTTSYKIWKRESQRYADQMARMAEFSQRHDTGRGHVPYYQDLSALPRPEKLLARAIAFYLPQFHTIPENDLWWGTGFTEWVNVRRARPQFQGHRQPRRPSELGYYNLMEDKTVRRRQAQLAYQYGLEGFCFYFYWFGGKRLLESPIEAWAQDEDITFPFCLCWANESWSRRWDGRDQEELIAQNHTPEDDIAFIEYISRYLKLGKYIRINGRPLVIIYRPDLFPDPAASANRMRTWCRENGIGEIYLAYTLSFVSGTPEDYGFDAAIEFPPNNMGLESKPEMVCPTGDDFSARIYDLTDLSIRSADYERPDYKLFRGVTPQWDNTARRMNKAAIMLDGGPESYGAWLRNAAIEMKTSMKSADERIVFINAWNEWAEGAYLEPDLDRGYAWLDATRRALTVSSETDLEPASLVPAEPMVDVGSTSKILMVVHDLFPNGAQLHSLFMAAAIREKYGYEIATIACGEGTLEPNFQCLGKLFKLDRKYTSEKNVRAMLARLKDQGFEHAIINTSACGWLTSYFLDADIECVGLVHEMPDLIRRMELEPDLKALNEHARHVIFSSELTQKLTAQEILGQDWKRAKTLPQGLYKAESILSPKEKFAALKIVQERLNLPDNAQLVLGAGYGDHRKGVDIFCTWALNAARQTPHLHFLWMGNLSPEMKERCEAMLLEVPEASKNIHFLGFQKDTGLFYRAASAYALTSREDPYPSTVLEALACGTPAFLVMGTTGLEEIPPTPAITVMADAAPATFVSHLNDLLSSPARWQAASQAGISLIQSDYGFLSFTGVILDLAFNTHPRISVVIPNYNYARYLSHRIATILNQELPVWEIIFLDDASTDDSLEVAELLLKDCGINYRIIPNTENSGSVFAQWKKGADLARGDIVWIAEADDWASARFTKVAAPAFDDPDVVISYTQSNQVSETSEILCPHYLDYVADIDRERWRRPFINDGAAELNDGFSVKNTIPNVSGVLFRREALQKVLTEQIEEIRSYRVAGDWCAYAHLARLGKIAFDPRPLNYHRRHSDSVTISRFTQAEWDEIARMQVRVRELGDVSEENQTKASTYLTELKQRL